MDKINLFKSTVLFLIFVSAVFLNSCSLDVEPRFNSNLEDVLNSPAGIESALNSIYGNLRSLEHYGRDMFAKSDALADGVRAIGNSGRLVAENNNQVNAHFSPAFWQKSYAAIGELNLILDQLEAGVEGATDAHLRQWEGEARFLRALYYFDLVKVYAYIPTAIYQPGVVDQGGIPMPLLAVRIADVAFLNEFPRASIQQVYIQITNDLIRSANILRNSGRRGVQYASDGAALALLSRVALYAGNWQLAADSANAALLSGVGQLLSGQEYVDGWATPVHPESFFEVRVQTPEESLGVNLSLQGTYNTLLDLENKNIRGGWGDLIPSLKVTGFFGLTPQQTGNPASDNNNWDVTRNEDIRSKLFTTGNDQKFARRQIESIKFMGKNGFAYGDNIPVIRASEMVLNRAEALFQLGRDAEALESLNQFKVSRGLDRVELFRQEILDEILEERFKEFAFEGQRFFDLKRYGLAIDKRSYLGPNAIVPFEDFRILAPIPTREVENNRNLNQNRGY
ncbi:RagB/SusD family nutrient uptake outer membrane protein [Cecembia lonarensis]|uniref:SusD family protein n=1 Tax=Cecembia lonarensis (strain CCUG 58316 / KCTC 22772 / LW9) TaxID=1225176 RepID=K1KZ24_CECL9|nr:RagB/SusD family nutrient uptake outer membrane protein [Cecembia lonarensis]EKB49430.1 SusD family protein [Cecembia lonarensis LW9]